MASASEFTAAEARAIADVSQRKLDYWDDIGLVSPSGSRPKKGSKKHGRGTKRRYTFNDLIRLRTVKKLRDAGLSLHGIGKALKKLRKRSSSSDGLLEVLITDGKSFQRVRADGNVEDLLADGQLVFGIVALGRIEKDVAGRVNRFTSKGRGGTRKARQIG